MHHTLRIIFLFFFSQLPLIIHTQEAVAAGFQDEFLYEQLLQAEFRLQQGDFEHAAVLFADLANFYTESKDTSGLAMVLLAESRLAAASGDLETFAIKNLRALQLFKQKENSRGVANCYINLGFYHKQTGNNEAANNYFTSADQLQLSLTRIARARLLQARSSLYLNLYYSTNEDSMLSQALVFQQLGESIADSIRHTKLKAQFSLLDIRIKKECALEDTSRALASLDSIIEVAELTDDFPTVTEAYLCKTDIMLSQQYNLSQARIYSDSAIAYAKIATSDLLLKESYHQSFLVAKARNNIMRSSTDLERYNFLNGLIRQRSSIQAVHKIESRTEIETRHKELTQLYQDRVISNSIVRKRERAILLFFALSAPLILLIFIRQRRHSLKPIHHSIANKYNILLHQLDPHFLFNSLNSIKRIYNEGNTEKANNILSDFSTLLRLIFDHAQKASIPIEEELNFLQLYINLQQYRLHKTINLHTQVDAKTLKKEINIPPFIFQPLIDNILWDKHSNSNKDEIIELSIEQLNGAIICRIQSNASSISKVAKDPLQFRNPKAIELLRERIGPEGELSIQKRTNKNITVNNLDFNSQSLAESKKTVTYSQGIEIVLKLPVELIFRR